MSMPPSGDGSVTPDNTPSTSIPAGVSMTSRLPKRRPPLSKDEGEGAALSGPDVETGRTASTSDDSGGAVDPGGYRSPQKHSQFAKGRSGNPNGRPKGVRNFATVIEAELNTKIPITEN